jgi:septum formation protein
MNGRDVIGPSGPCQFDRRPILPIFPVKKTIFTTIPFSTPETMTAIVLASASPRRIEILKTAGYAFDVLPSDVDESTRPDESPADYVLRLAIEKASAITPESPSLVIGADTTVVADGEILAKPEDAEDARRMLRLLSNRVHDVLTGVAVRRTADGAIRAACEVTKVWFEELSEEWMTDYINSGEPFGKAGAYAIQGIAGTRISRIDGNYLNVVGLPATTVRRLVDELQT